MQPSHGSKDVSTASSQKSPTSPNKKASDETQSLLSRSHNHASDPEEVRVLVDRASTSGTSPGPSCEEVPDPLNTTDLPRSLTVLNGLAFVVGLQIGAGIFSSPSAIFTNVGSPGLALLVWLLAGLLAWTGASSFIELGSIVPLNGGVQEYLRYCYNDTCGFLAAWTWILVVKPCSTAMLSLTFSEYLIRALVIHEVPSIWTMRATGLVVVTLITYMNCIGTGVGANIANVFLFLKFVGLGSIILSGLVIGIRDLGHSRPNLVTVKSWVAYSSVNNDSFWVNLGSYTDAILAALWAYSGWEALGLVAGELRNPQRNLPRVINSAMIIVIFLFILANIAYFIVIPLDELGRTNTISLDFGRIVFGPVGALFYAWIVCLSCVGGLNAKIFTAGRMTEAAVRRNYLPALLAKSFAGILEDDGERLKSFSAWQQRLLLIRQSSSVPVNAMLLNLCLTFIYLFLGTFRSLTIFVGMVESTTLLAAVFGVLVLRSRNDTTDLPRYRTFTINPIIYCAIISVVVVRSAIRHPVQGLIIIVFYGAGICAYRFKSRYRQGYEPLEAGIESG